MMALIATAVVMITVDQFPLLTRCCQLGFGCDPSLAVEFILLVVVIIILGRAAVGGLRIASSAYCLRVQIGRVQILH